MKRYIDAENAKSYIYGQFVDRFPPFTLGAIIEGMDDIETEEVAPVVHAKWIEEEEPCEIVFITPDGKATTELYIEFKCSNCKRYTGYVYSHYLACQNEYCQHCGAKMDGKEGKE